MRLLLLSLALVSGLEDVRAGQCPLLAPGTVGTCIMGCESDASCAVGQKCCSNGCGRTCQRAVIRGCVCGQPCTMESGGSGVCQTDGQTCAVNIQPPQCGGTGAPHAGQCPLLGSGSVGICVEACSGDNSCAMDEKCCSNGCGRTCQKAVTFPPPVPPRCVCGEPCRMASGGSGVCQTDGQCAVNIQPPLCGGTGGVPHAGECPAVARDILGICIDQCSSDNACAKDEKCCSNGCGRVCKKITSLPPLPPARCICGQPCKMGARGSGVCQVDGTCAVNIQAPRCGLSCVTNANCSGNRFCVRGMCQPRPKGM